MKKQDQQIESLNHIESNQSVATFDIVIEGFMEMGIPEEDILPKENVYTFQAKMRIYPNRTTVFHIRQTEKVKK